MFYQLIKILFILALSFILSRTVPAEIRKKLFPYVVGVLILNYVIGGILGNSTLVYLVLGSLPILCPAFLLHFDPKDRIRLRATEKVFIVFYIYYACMPFFDDFPVTVFYEKGSTFLFHLLTGWSVARYAVKNNQFDRLMTVLVFFIIPFYAIFWMTTYNAPDLAAGERMGDEDTMNQNAIGLLCALTLMIPMISLISLRNGIIHKAMAAFSILIGGFLLIATGSRNAFGAFVCGALVVVGFCSRYKRLRVLSPIFVIIIVSTFLYFRSHHDLRVFDISVESASESRFDIYREFFDGSSSAQWLFGGRSLSDVSPITLMPVWCNAHSMYVQILYESGYIGLSLFILYVIFQLLCIVTSKRYGWYALAFLVTALVSGAAESYPIRPGSMSSLFWGFSIGLLNFVPTRVALSLPTYNRKV